MDNYHPHLSHINLTPEKERRLLDNYKRVAKYYDFNGKVIFDYGCGGGYFSEWVTNNYQCGYVGYDISNRSIEAAQQRNPSLAFTDDLDYCTSYDVLVCLAVIQHMTLKQYSEFIDYIKRIKPIEVVLQYRYNHQVTESEDIINRLSMPHVFIPGYEMVSLSDIQEKDNYIIKIMRCK